MTSRDRDRRALGLANSPRPNSRTTATPPRFVDLTPRPVEDYERALWGDVPASHSIDRYLWWGLLIGLLLVLGSIAGIAYLLEPLVPAGEPLVP